MTGFTLNVPTLVESSIDSERRHTFVASRHFEPEPVWNRFLHHTFGQTCPVLYAGLLQFTGILTSLKSLSLFIGPANNRGSILTDPSTRPIATREGAMCNEHLRPSTRL